MVILLLWKRN